MRTKIVLFNPLPARNNEFIGLPLALLAISRYLNKNRYKVKIISAFLDKDYKERLVAEMKDALCLGITAMTGYQIYDALNVCRAVREKYPKKKIVWGGWHPSITSAQTLDSEFVDIVCIGQGERTFPEIVKAIEIGDGFGKIKGIAYKENGKKIITQPRSIENINSFPDVPFDLIEIEKYLSHTRMGKRTINYISSYGCPFNCGFCAEAVVNRRTWSGLEAGRVVSDIKTFYREYGIDSIIFNDSNFFVSEERVREICQGLLSAGIKIRWGQANGTASVMNKFKTSTFRLMEESGCCSILIGAESGLSGILRYINKSGDVQDIIDVAKRCRDFNIKIIPSFIMGFPKDKTSKAITVADEFRSTLGLIKRMMKITKNMEVLWFNYTPYPGTPLYQRSIDLGFKEPRCLEEWARFELTNFSNIDWISRKYSSRINLLMKFVFPLVLDNNVIIEDMSQKHFVFQLGVLLMKKTANLRLKFNFYDFPIDYILTKAVYNLFRKTGR